MQIRHSSRTWIFRTFLICYYTHISETNPFGFITIAISGGLTIIFTITFLDYVKVYMNIC